MWLAGSRFIAAVSANLAVIERDPLVEARIEPIDRHIVQAITWSIRNGISPPPILVYAVGPRRGKRFLLVDGRNRIAATRSTGGTEIMAEIIDGTLEQATWAAAAANGRAEVVRHLLSEGVPLASASSSSSAGGGGAASAAESAPLVIQACCDSGDLAV